MRSHREVSLVLERQCAGPAPANSGVGGGRRRNGDGLDQEITYEKYDQAKLQIKPFHKLYFTNSPPRCIEKTRLSPLPHDVYVHTSRGVN